MAEPYLTERTALAEMNGAAHTTKDRFIQDHLSSDDGSGQINGSSAPQFAGLLRAANAVAKSEPYANNSVNNMNLSLIDDVLLGGSPRQAMQLPQFPASDHLNGDSGSRKRKRESRGFDDNIEAHEIDQPRPSKAVERHAASALFRKVPSSTKKHTRPPMSKLFESLHLAPDEFMHLQSAARAYMLDPEHPDRQGTVGLRGKEDMDLVRLRLWSCVKDFLEVEGYGEQFFGANVQRAETEDRLFIWPQDKDAIITAVMPLLRRMVTNERQRQYAVEVRKNPPSQSTAATTENNSAGSQQVDTLIADQATSERMARDFPDLLFEVTENGRTRSLFSRASYIFLNTLRNHIDTLGSETTNFSFNVVLSYLLTSPQLDVGQSSSEKVMDDYGLHHLLERLINSDIWSEDQRPNLEDRLRALLRDANTLIQDLKALGLVLGT